jgi:hypothetical protein
MHAFKTLCAVLEFRSKLNLCDAKATTSPAFASMGSKQSQAGLPRDTRPTPTQAEISNVEQALALTAGWSW